MMDQRLTGAFLAGVLFILTPGAYAQIDRDMNWDLVRKALEQDREALETSEERFRESLVSKDEKAVNARALFGYNPPGRAIQRGFLFGALYRQFGLDADAQAATDSLLRMVGYREALPAGMFKDRPEYEHGLPPVPSFFQLAEFARAFKCVRDWPGLSVGDRETIRDAIASSANYIFVFPEWGAHNRALLRAECLLTAADACPDHPDASRWRKMGNILWEDSRGQWEIEDAQIYHPIWLLAFFEYADLSGDREALHGLQVRYYLRYFLELLSPLGTIPDFGDASWNSQLPRYYECLEWGARLFQDPELKWGAMRFYQAMAPFDEKRPGLGRALMFARLVDRIDADLAARAPTLRNGAVLDDVIGKKIVFRTGLEENDLYLLQNFRDEGDWGRLHRDFLRETLAVEEEKMHHGHADEGSIVLWMDRGAVLLHDAGYRELMPSGPYGAFRADIFHNRLVWRRGRLSPQQNVLEFLRNSGAYQKVTSEKIDFVAFDPLDYSRTRVIDSVSGVSWDRTLVFVKPARAFVVFDTVRVDRDDYYTLANLWATEDIVNEGPGYVEGRILGIGGRELDPSRHLGILFAGDSQTPQSFPLRRHSREERVVHDVESRYFRAGEFEGFVTVLSSVAPGDSVAELRSRVHAVETSHDRRAWGVRISFDDLELHLALKADDRLGLVSEDVRPRYDLERGHVIYGPLGTDADFAWMAETKTKTHWGAVNMTHVDIRGERVFESARSAYFQTSGRADFVGRAKWRRWDGEIVK